MNDIMEYTDGEGGSLVIEKNTEGGISIYGNLNLNEQVDVVGFASWLDTVARQLSTANVKAAGVDANAVSFASKNPMEE